MADASVGVKMCLCNNHMGIIFGMFYTVLNAKVGGAQFDSEISIDS